MKSVYLTYFRVGEIFKTGPKAKSFSEDMGVLQNHDGVDFRYCGATSEKIRSFFQNTNYADRKVFAQLTISIDDIELTFTLPEELDYVCDIFETVPFPTALSLAKKDPNESQLNRHWLSRLPKKVKDKKYRERFVKYVNSAPKKIRDFRSFYDN